MESKIKILPFPLRHYYNFSFIEELAKNKELRSKVEKLKTETTMLDEIDRRLLVLEEKSAYQEQTIDALNDVIIEQQAQLNALEEQLGRLRALLTTMHDRPNEGEDPPPPHY